MKKHKKLKSIVLIVFVLIFFFATYFVVEYGINRSESSILSFSAVFAEILLFIFLIYKPIKRLL